MLDYYLYFVIIVILKKYNYFLILNMNKIADSSISCKQVSTSNEISTIRQKIQAYVSLMTHAIDCLDTDCSIEDCSKLKALINHSNSNKCNNNDKNNTTNAHTTTTNTSNNNSNRNGCKFCRQYLALCVYHARICTLSSCNIPFCASIKQKLQIMNMLDIVKKNLELLKYKACCDFQVQVNVDFEGSNGHIIDADHTIQTNNANQIEDVPLDPSLCHSIEMLDDELNDRKEEFLNKLNQIKANVQNRSDENEYKMNESNNQFLIQLNRQLNKQEARKQLIKFLFDLVKTETQSENEQIYNDLKYATLARLIIKSEIEICKKVVDTEEYLYLLSELAFRISNESNKYTKSEMGIQVNLEEKRKNEENDDADEENVNNNLLQPNKRFKTC